MVYRELTQSEFTDLAGRILYEDNHLLIVNKKSGEIIQGDKTGDECIADAYKAFIAQRDNKPGQVFIGIPHRLDRPVSGICILAKTSKALGRLGTLLRESGVLPGAYIKSYKVARTGTEPPSADFDGGEWARAEWAELSGMQMEKVKQKARFKALAGTDALYVAMESDLADDSPLDAFDRDGPVWKTENCDMLISPGASTDKRCHFIFSPIDGSFYDARYGFLKDPLDPYFRKDDARWNGPVETRNSRGGGKWRLFIKMPYAALEAKAPKSGAKWRFNIGRDTNKYVRPSKPVQLLWNPNLQSRSFVSPYAMGNLVFE